MGWGDIGHGLVAPSSSPQGGWGSVGNGTAVAPPKSKPGGILGAIQSVEGALKSGAHTVASKTDLAAHDIAAIPTGIVELGQADAGTVRRFFTEPMSKNNAKQWSDLFSGHLGRLLKDASAPDASAGSKLGAAAVTSSIGSVEHPGRDPFQTLLTLSLIGGSAAGAASRGAAVADAARAGDLGGAARAIVTKPPVTPRILQVPKLEAPEGEGPPRLVHEPVQLQASAAPLARALQAAHDTIIQKALDRNVSAAEPSRLANYAGRRVGKVASETTRVAQSARLVGPQLLERAGRSFDKGVSPKAGQLALFLRSANVTGQEAADYWAGQAARGVNPADTGALAKLAQQVHDQGLIGMGADGNVAVNADRFPKLASVDQLVGENQASRAAIIQQHRLMSPEGMQTRLNLVASKMVPGDPAALKAELDSIDKEWQQLVGNAMAAKPGDYRRLTAVQNGRLRRGNYPTVTAQLRADAEKNLVTAMRNHPDDPAVKVWQAKLARADAIRSQLESHGEASLFGEGTPLTVRQGQGYTSLKTSVRRQPQSPIAASRTPIISRARGFIGGKPATGAGVAKGLIPDNTTAGVAAANREALRYLGTVEHRGQVARFGSEVRRTGDDVLVADPTAEGKLGEIPTSTSELLGRTRSTLNTIPEAEHQGLAAAARARLEDAIPGLRDGFATDRAAGLGTRAPAGYKWVPRQMLGELVQETTPRSGLARGINNVNSAVTAMTVYFKLSHIPQRLTTNATTSLLAGALRPSAIRAAVEMRRALSDREYAEAAAVTGTHGYLALPHEGTARIARVATRGAGFYAHRIDSPFRFLNLVNEARREGFTTPEQFRQIIAHAKNPGTNAGDATAMKMDYVLRRANRVSMMYDGLGANEKRILARGLWFYPWTKAAVRFAGHTLAEHPLKAAALGALGNLGEQEQQQRLGALPSYEYGLTPFGGGARPETSDFGVLSPFGTVANVAETVARPGGISGFANPVAGAALTAATGVNSHGNKTTSPIGDALSQLFAPTPEAQIVSAALHPARPTQVFRKTPLSQLLRSVAGPSLPRRTNRAALNSAAAREKTGR